MCPRRGFGWLGLALVFNLVSNLLEFMRTCQTLIRLPAYLLLILVCSTYTWGLVRVNDGQINVWRLQVLACEGLCLCELTSTFKFAPNILDFIKLFTRGFAM